MHTLTVTVLGSGSCGNSILVSSDGSGILIDAGISCKELERRLSLFGADPDSVEAVVLTHEHTDHTRGTQRFCSKHGVKAYGTDGTLSLTPLDGVETVAIASTKPLQVGRFTLKPTPVKHFAAEPVAFSVTLDGVKVGIASDLGCVTPRIVEEMSGADMLLIEANYDDHMLVHGTYPDFLKRTIRGDHGHLSNDDAGLLASKASCERTRKVVLLHLSKENNTPEKAAETVSGQMRKHGVSVDLSVTEHGGSNGPFSLR